MKDNQDKITLEQLTKIKSRSGKRLGRGYGSGKGGHTVGRGTKGNKARGKIPLTFSGTKIKKSALKRLPLARGRGKLKPLESKPVVVNVRYLNLLPTGTVVNVDSLVKYKIVGEKDAKRFGVKILGDGQLNIPLKIELPCSRKVVEIVEKVGGEVVNSIKAARDGGSPIVQSKKPGTKKRTAAQ